MDDMKLFVPITKIDAAQRLVYGVVTAERPDVTGEVCDYTFSANALSYNGLEVMFDFGNNFGTSGKTVQITECDIRVTPGVATGLNGNPPPPELRPVGAELPLNQRYFIQWTSEAASSPFFLGFLDTTTTFRGTLTFPKMRAAPTFSFSAYTTFAAHTITNNSTLAGSGNPSAGTVTSYSADIIAGISTATTIGTGGFLRDGGSANSFIQAVAEL